MRTLQRSRDPLLDELAHSLDINHRIVLQPRYAYSHSIVLGGFELMS